jgi:hypothetical protein
MPGVWVATNGAQGRQPGPSRFGMSPNGRQNAARRLASFRYARTSSFRSGKDAASTRQDRHGRSVLGAAAGRAGGAGGWSCSRRRRSSQSWWLRPAPPRAAASQSRRGVCLMARQLQSRSPVPGTTHTSRPRTCHCMASGQVSTLSHLNRGHWTWQRTRRGWGDRLPR